MVRVVPPGQGGSPGHHSTGSGGGGGGISSSSGGAKGAIPAPGFSGWEVQQTPQGPRVIGAVTSTGQLIRPGGVWPGTGGKRLIVPPNFNSSSPANVSPGAPGGGPPFVPPPSGGGGGGGGGFTSPVSVGGSGTSASSSLSTALGGMFPFITDFGNALPTVSIGSIGSTIEDVAQVFGKIGALLGQGLRGVEILFTPTFWVRAACFFIGVPVGIYGLIQLGRANSGGGTAMGILATSAAFMFLFLAFHNLPDTVTSPGTLASFIQSEIQGGGGISLTAASQPYPTASIMEPPLPASSVSPSAGSTGP